MRSFRRAGATRSIIGVIAAAISLSSCVPESPSVPVPRNISTVADGFPFAQELKNRLAPDAEFVMAQISLDRKGDVFEISDINYRFTSRTGKGRTLQITLVNWRHQAFVTFNHSGVHETPYYYSGPSQPMGVPAIDVPQILELARTNGLGDFCARAPGKSGEVYLTLTSSTNGVHWLVIGDGMDDKEDVPGVHLRMNAKTGAVIDRDFEKSGGRP